MIPKGPAEMREGYKIIVTESVLFRDMKTKYRIEEENILWFYRFFLVTAGFLDEDIWRIWFYVFFIAVDIFLLVLNWHGNVERETCCLGAAVI